MHSIYFVAFKPPNTIDKPDGYHRRVRVVVDKKTLAVIRLEMSVYSWRRLENLYSGYIHDLVLSAVYDGVVHQPVSTGMVSFFSPYMDYIRCLNTERAKTLASDFLDSL